MQAAKPLTREVFLLLLLFGQMETPVSSVKVPVDSRSHRLLYSLHLQAMKVQSRHIPFLAAGHINVFHMQWFCKQNLLVVDPLCIPLQNVEWSCGSNRVRIFPASSIYPPHPKPGSSHWDGVNTIHLGRALLRHRAWHSTQVTCKT